jgi:hypothetical protein
MSTCRVFLEKVYQLNLEASGASFIPTHVTVENHDLFSCQIITTNSAGFSCDLSVEGSNELTTNYEKITGSDTTLTGNDVQVYDIIDTAVSYCRLNFSNITGSATVSIRWTMK